MDRCTFVARLCAAINNQDPPSIRVRAVYDDVAIYFKDECEGMVLTDVGDTSDVQIYPAIAITVLRAVQDAVAERTTVYWPAGEPTLKYPEAAAVVADGWLYAWYGDAIRRLLSLEPISLC
jgi:hypothetical protein